MWVYCGWYEVGFCVSIRFAGFGRAYEVFWSLEMGRWGFIEEGYFGMVGSVGGLGGGNGMCRVLEVRNSLTCFKIVDYFEFGVWEVFLGGRD